MPELPEVERVRAALDPLLAGRRILEVRVAAPKLIARPDAEAFCTALAGPASWGCSGAANSSACRWRAGPACCCICA